jgi:signal transduction histidine kinase
MNDETSFAVHCDLQGRIVKILRNESALTIHAGQSLYETVDLDNLEKLAQFLIEIKTKQAAFHWEMNLVINQKSEPFYFFGAMAEPLLLIIAGVSTHHAVYGFYEELMQINNEQIDMLRSILKNIAIQSFQKESPDCIHDEIAELNNELVNAQRELARKNAALDECNQKLTQVIEELEKTRDHLTDSNQQLNELNQQKDRFLGMVVHDLRNPLGVIKCTSELCLMDAEDAEQIELLQMVKDSSTQMLNLVNDLLNIVRIQRAVIDLDYQTVALKPFIDKIIKNQQLLANCKAIRLKVDFAVDATKTIYCDPKRIQQVLINLMGNAIKFSSPQSEICLRIRDFQDKTELSVIDYGAGIALEEQDKIFGEFQMASNYALAGEPGFGLGLLICKKIIELHKGTIGVESELGKGSRFYFVI